MPYTAFQQHSDTSSVPVRILIVWKAEAESCLILPRSCELQAKTALQVYLLKVLAHHAMGFASCLPLCQNVFRFAENAEPGIRDPEGQSDPQGLSFASGTPTSGGGQKLKKRRPLQRLSQAAPQLCLVDLNPPPFEGFRLSF